MDAFKRIKSTAKTASLKPLHRIPRHQLSPSVNAKLDIDAKKLEGIAELFGRAHFEAKIYDTALGSIENPSFHGTYPPLGNFLVVARHDFGRMRRHIVIAEHGLTAQKGVARYQHYLRFLPQHFDGFWIIVDKVDDNWRRNERKAAAASGIEVMSYSDLERTLKRYFPPETRRSGTISNTGKNKAKTKIGKAVLASEKDIQLAIASLELQIDGKLAELASERPNSPDAIARKEAEISNYNDLKEQLKELKRAIAQFKNGEIKETTTVKATKTFSNGVQSFWTANYNTICQNTYSMALFATAVGVCSLAGAGGPLAVSISGALVGGKPIVEVIKGLAKKIFT